MKKKTVSILVALTLASGLALTACSANVNVGSSEEAVATQETSEEETKVEEVAEEIAEEVSEEDAQVSDQEAADAVAALIDAIYVQQRTETTDEDCAKAKEAWDALTDAQKELVEGEEADPDYFGRDTGDGSLDNPLNQDEIGENEILVVSFGTSFNDSRVADIGGIESAIAKAYPEWSVRRAFTAQIIINHVQAREGDKIDNMEQALERAVNNNVKNLIVQPTHLMHGAEYDEMCEMLANYSDKFESVKVAEPLLGEVGKEATDINEDKERVAASVVDATVEASDYDSIDALKEDGTAIVLMGHGTSHTAKVSYSQMQTQMLELGYDNVYIGTVEGEPEETECENVMEAVHEAGYSKVILRPLMVVAGDHANNDMAGEEDDSWISIFINSGYFDEVTAQIAGMGSIEAIQDIYVEHTAAAIDSDAAVSADANADGDVVEDGVYTADFDTDSSMFHINEAYDGKGTVTVKDGKATIHIVMPSDSIVNLYLGLAADAEADEANWIAATEEEVEYEDGTKETVNAFDVPVPVIGEEFDLALIGKKNKWYDHKVIVKNLSADEADDSKKK